MQLRARRELREGHTMFVMMLARLTIIIAGDEVFEANKGPVLGRLPRRRYNPLRGGHRYPSWARRGSS